jgi:hypothetical protein
LRYRLLIPPAFRADRYRSALIVRLVATME